MNTNHNNKTAIETTYAMSHLAADLYAAMIVMCAKDLDKSRIDKPQTDAGPEVNPTVAVLFPDGISHTVRFDDCKSLFTEMGSACEFRLDDVPCNLMLPRRGLVSMENETFLTEPAVALFRDGNGDPVSCTEEMLAELAGYLEQSCCELSFGSVKFPAVRLKGEIVAALQVKPIEPYMDSKRKARRREASGLCNDCFIS